MVVVAQEDELSIESDFEPVVDELSGCEVAKLSCEGYNHKPVDAALLNERSFFRG